MMRKIIVITIVILMMLALGAWTPKTTVQRCPFCGTENAFTWYGDPGNSFGTCSRCGETTDRHSVCGHVYGNNGANVILELYKGGKLIRSNSIPGDATDNVFSFISVNRGLYMLVVRCEGYYPVYRVINAHRDINGLNIKLYPRRCK